MRRTLLEQLLLSPARPRRDADVLLCLQLLAYLYRYPNVLQTFYKPRASFHSASLGFRQAKATCRAERAFYRQEKEKEKEESKAKLYRQPQWDLPHKSRALAALNSAGLGDPHVGGSSSASSAALNLQARQRSAFSLVERLTFKASSNEAPKAPG